MENKQKIRGRLPLPRNLMARGLLILLLPILLMQVVVGVLIVQRYYDQVTGQLSQMVIDNIRYAERNAKNQDRFAEILTDMGFRFVFVDELAPNDIGLGDLSGRYIAQNFRQQFGEDVSIAADGNKISLGIPTKFGLIELNQNRTRFAPENPHQIFMNVLLFSFVFLIVAALFLRNQVRSVRRLSQAAEAFGRGDTVPYTPSGAAEVRSAGVSFINMRRRIERQREQRGLLLSGVSHDLRTPLTRLRLAVEMLDNDEGRSHMLADIHDMDQMISSFLDYATLDATEDFSTVNLERFLKNVAGKYQSVKIVQNSNIQIRIRPLLMRRAIENLLNNSDRYAERTEISTHYNKGELTIRIDDDGPGIKAHDREKAMTAFQQLEVARNQDQGAHAGLGLAIAADIIRRHGGVMRLTDSPLGGLRVEMELPRA